MNRSWRQRRIVWPLLAAATVTACESGCAGPGPNVANVFYRPAPHIAPLGSISDPTWVNQVTRAQASKFVLYDHEFKLRAVQMNMAGEDHLKQIAARLLSDAPFQVIVEPQHERQYQRQVQLPRKSQSRVGQPAARFCGRRAAPDGRQRCRSASRGGTRSGHTGDVAGGSISLLARLVDRSQQRHVRRRLRRLWRFLAAAAAASSICPPKMRQPMNHNVRRSLRIGFTPWSPNR